MQEKEDAKKAYIALNGHNFHGRTLEVRSCPSCVFMFPLKKCTACLSHSLSHATLLPLHSASWQVGPSEGNRRLAVSNVDPLWNQEEFESLLRIAFKATMDHVAEVTLDEDKSGGQFKYVARPRDSALSVVVFRLDLIVET
jgi:hypothetical protein